MTTNNEHEISTNVDLYQRVMATLEARKGSTVSLESYLRRIWELITERKGSQPLGLAEFVQLLDDAFEGRPGVEVREFEAAVGADGWQGQLARQVVDLHQMAEAGTLADEMRFFGIDAPSGARWYNFDPQGYIECGLAGSVGGWTPAANGNRQLVPGPVAVMNADGSIGTAKPEELEEPIIPMQHIPWNDFEEFLWAGQNYE
jgi:hypothetical protein